MRTTGEADTKYSQTGTKLFRSRGKWSYRCFGSDASVNIKLKCMAGYI